MPAQHGQAKSGSGGKGAGPVVAACGIFPLFLDGQFRLCFLRILHPAARCPDCPFCLGCKFSLLKSYVRLFLFGNSLEGNSLSSRTFDFLWQAAV